MYLFFTDELIRWYRKYKRDLPWRHTSDPYHIWVSEVILQQTRVSQGHNYYLNFLKRFPDVYSLANSSIDDVLKIWQGLGYYSRARNMHAAAKEVVKKYNGIFPDSYEALIDLNGIGDYTASAILSIAFKKPFPVIDGNVLRVLSRCFGIEDPVNASIGKSKVKKLAGNLIEFGDPSDFNQAVMEFGALQCIPTSPDCNSCIFKETCFANLNNKVAEIPLNTKKKTNRKRFFNYLVIINLSDTGAKIALERRGEKDIWKGLHEFPLFESKKELNIDTAKKILNEKISSTSKKPEMVFISPQFIHKLTHQTIYARFYVYRTAKLKTNDLYFVDLKDVKDYAVSRLIEKFLQESNWLENFIEKK